MVRITCHDYGHDCDFEIEGILEEVIEQYNIHSEQEHGIAYTKETLEHRFTALQISQ